MKTKSLLLIGFLVLVVAVIILTWGSIGSAVMAMGLISMISALLYRRFLNRDDPDLWDTL